MLRRKLAPLALLVLALAAARLAPAAAPAPTSWHPASDLVLVPPHEPGVPLLIEGRVLADTVPLVGAKLHAYQQDASGRYSWKPGAPNRLAGDLVTGPEGRFRIRTVVPGLAEGSPHLHLSIEGPRGGSTRLTLALCRTHGAGTDSAFARFPLFVTEPTATGSDQWARVEHAADTGFVCRPVIRLRPWAAH
jgi:hypothetical protein